MLVTTDDIIAAWLSPSRQLSIRVKVDDATYGSEDVTSLSFDSGSISGETYQIGSTYMNSIQLNFPSLIETVKEDMEVVPELGVLVNGTYEYTKLGHFFIDEFERNRNNNTTTIRATDKMRFMEGPYESKLSYQKPYREVALEVANLAGVEINVASFSALGTAAINKPEGYTFRQAIGLIAQFEGGFASFNRNGELEIRRLAPTNFEITPESYMLKGFTKNEVSYRIGGITVKTGEEETDVIRVGSTNGSQVQLENRVMTQQLLNQTWELVKDLNYFPYELKWRGCPALEAGDWIYVTANDGTKYSVPNLSYSITFNGGMSAESKATTSSSSQATYKYRGPLNQRIDYLDSILSSNNWNSNYYDTTEPLNPKEGDIWFKPNGQDREIWIYKNVDGVLDWVMEITSAGDPELLAAIEEAVQAGKDAQLAAEEAKTAAADAKQAGEEAQKVGAEAKAAAENAKRSADDAKAVGENAKQAANDAKQAGENAAILAAQAQETADDVNQRIGDVVIDIGDIQGDVNTIAADVGNVQTDIGKIITDATATASKANDAFNKASAVEGRTSTLETSVGSIKSTMTDIEMDLDSTTKKINEVSVTVDGQTTEIASVKSTATSALTKANTVEQTVDGQKTTITSIQTNLDNNITKVNQITETVDGHTQLIASATTTANSALTKANSVSSTVDGLTVKISSVETTANAANTKALQVEATTSGLTSTVTQVQTDLNNLSVGGRNYFKNSDVERTASREFVTHSTWDMAPLIDQNGMDVYYTVSFDIKSAVAGNINVYSQNGSGTRYNIGTKTIQVTTAFKRYSYTFKPNSINTNWSQALLAFYGSYDSGIIPTVKNVKFELGNKATDWSPAVEDLATSSQFTQLSTDINLKVSKGDVINQINVGTESILIAGNKLNITAQTTIDNAVIKTAHIVDLAVSTAKISDLAVNEGKIGNLAVTNAKIANLSVTEGKIGDAAITNAKIGNLAVSEGKIADLAVSSAKIANLAVTETKIGDAAITNAKIGNLAVSTAKIADGAIVNAKIGDAAITNAKIADASISSAKIINLDASKIVANNLAAITANTGTLNVSGYLNILNQDTGVYGNYDYGDSLTGSYNPRWYTGSWRIGTNVFRHTADIYSLTTAGAKGTRQGYFETSYGSDYVAMRKYNTSTSLTMSARVDINSDRIQVSNSWNETSGVILSANGEMSASEVRSRGAAYLQSTLDVAGASYLRSSVDISGGLITRSTVDMQGSVLTRSRVDVQGSLWLTGDSYINSMPTYDRTTSSAANMIVTSNGYFARSTSARKYKADIKIADDVIEKAKKILSIRPVSWLDKAEVVRGEAKYRYYGFIADEFDAVGLKEVVAYGENDQIESLAYDRLTMYQNVVLGEHEREIQKLNQKVLDLQAKIEELEAA